MESGGAQVINNDTVSCKKQVDNSNNYQQLIEEIKEMKKMLYEQQQLQSRDEKIRILETSVYDMRSVMNTIVENMRD